jgi:peptidyl-prolyl cis-trans isomerase C
VRLGRLAVVGVLVAASAHAQPNADEARRAKVVARVGERTVTVGELEDRLAGVPPWQATTFGSTKDEIARAFLDQVIVRDLLLVSAAEQRGLSKKLPYSHQLRRALSTAALRAVRKDIPTAAAIPMEDVRRYYEDNRSHFDSPERINLWRILVATRAEAETVLEAAKREPTITKYNELARQHSIDKATNMRGGNLGFLGPDGVSNEAGVKVDPALVKAASGVADGSFVATPVPEGGGFAVVWRRATVPATRRTVDEAAAQIRTTLYRQRTEAAEKKLIDDLRAKRLEHVDEAPLAIIEFAAIDAGFNLPRSIPKGPSSSPR